MKFFVSWLMITDPFWGFSGRCEVEIPLKKVNHEQHYRAQISTAVEATGKNDDVHKGRPSGRVLW